MDTTIDENLAVCVMIEDCFTVDLWERSFGKSTAELLEAGQMLDKPDYDRMYRAALLFSLISLRKVEENQRKDDLRASHFGISLEHFSDSGELLSKVDRDAISKGIAHITSKLDPSSSELKNLRGFLCARAEVLSKILDWFFARASAPHP